MNVSVVIPAHNEEQALAYCLQGLATQKTQHEVTVIIVDNASTDKTSKVASAWQDRLNLKIITEPRLGRGAARKAGFSIARTDIILSTDADSVVPTDWVEVLVNAITMAPKVIASTSPSYITDGSKITNATMAIGMPFSLRMYRLLMGHYMVTGGTFAVRRSAYIKAGGFDAEQDMLDDVDLSFRLAKIGEIVYLPKLRVKTEGDVFRAGYISGFWHYFKHWPVLYKKYKT